MEKQTISFRLDADKVSALDALGKALDRDRTYLLNEAVAAYLEVQQWHLEHVKAALRQAEQGKLLEHADIRKRTAKWRQR
jgi:predicted transcriptional regulator